MNTAILHETIADAVFAGQIMTLPQGDELDTAHLIAGTVEDLAAEFGKPSDDEIVQFGAALASKVSGMAADGVATFAGKPVTIEDGETLDGMDGYRIVVLDQNALFSFDEDEMEMVLQ
jgi:hypothetical protein